LKPALSTIAPDVPNMIEALLSAARNGNVPCQASGQKSLFFKRKADNSWRR